MSVKHMLNISRQCYNENVTAANALSTYCILLDTLWNNVTDEQTIIYYM